jgi:hypothetical protein
VTTTKRLNLSVDDRTDKLTDEALFCRTLGHKWAVQAITRKRFQELIALGHSEFRRYCEHGCGSTWRQLWDVRTGEVLENDRSYPSGGEYLMPPNSGRLKRSQARVAQFARQHPSYA